MGVWKYLIDVVALCLLCNSSDTAYSVSCHAIRILAMTVILQSIYNGEEARKHDSHTTCCSVVKDEVQSKRGLKKSNHPRTDIDRL